MKKIFVILACVVLSTAVHAQFTQGSFLVGGSVSGNFDTNKAKSGSTSVTLGHTNTISFSPQAGYFVMDNFALGAGIDVSSSTFKDEDGDKDNFTSTSFAPFARYYYEKAYIHAGGDFGSAKSKFTSGSTSTETKYSVSGWNVALGYAILLNDHVALEPQIGYGSMSNKNKSNDITGTDSGLFIKIGFQVYLPK